MTEIAWDGQPIGEPGLYVGVPMSAYHGQLTTGPSVSSSVLRTVWQQSPAHAWIGSYMDPDRDDSPEARPHFAIGRCAHKVLLEGLEGFYEEFALRPEKWSDWRTNDSKAWRADQWAEGKTIITDAEFTHIVGMAKALSEHPLVRLGILDGLVERSLVYKDAETGIWVKSRPDAIPADADLSDLKTTTDVSDEALARTIATYGYHQQGALAGEAMRHVLGVEMESFTLVFVEKEPPYSVRVVTIAPEDITRGAQQNRVAVNAFAQCVETGIWTTPGAGADDAVTLPLPTWYRNQTDTRLSILIPEIEQAKYEATRND